MLNCCICSDPKISANYKTYILLSKFVSDFDFKMLRKTAIDVGISLLNSTLYSSGGKLKFDSILRYVLVQHQWTMGKTTLQWRTHHNIFTEKMFINVCFKGVSSFMFCYKQLSIVVLCSVSSNFISWFYVLLQATLYRGFMFCYKQLYIVVLCSVTSNFISWFYVTFKANLYRGFIFCLKQLYIVVFMLCYKQLCIVVLCSVTSNFLSWFYAPFQATLHRGIYVCYKIHSLVVYVLFQAIWYCGFYALFQATFYSGL
jgi:hypothetical protein